jgi:nitrate/nitrite transporter NarK
MADRYGSRKVMALSILGIASFTVLFGVARDFCQVALTRFLAGLLGAGVFVPGVRLVSGWFSSEARGTALGILSIGGSVGLIVSSFLTPHTAIRLGWRGTMVVFGLLGILSTVAMWLTIKDRSVEGVPGGGRADLKDVVGSRGFWILAVLQMVRLGSNYALIAWLPLLLREEFGLSLVAAGAAFSLFNFSGMVSNPIGGFVSDRVGERPVLLASFAVLGLSTFLFAGARADVFLYLTVFAMGWFINFVRSPSFAILPRLYGVERAGKVSGVQNTFASVGALALPFLLGYIKDTTASYWAGWTILSLLMFMVAGLSLLLRTPTEDGAAR